MTKQRRELLRFLKANADRQLTAREICEELQKLDISQSAVYRNLAFLEGRLLVKSAGERENLYRYVRDACAVCLHLTCTVCGAICHLRNSEAERLEKTILNSDDFFVDRKKTVIYGKCKKCR